MQTDRVAEFERIVAEAKAQAERVDVPARLKVIQARCRRQAKAHLGDWMVAVEEALHCLLQLHEILAEAQCKEPVQQRAVAMMGIGRACACLAGTRQLLLDGLEDVARTVARSLLETLELAMIALIDEEFAAEFLGNSLTKYDADAFWKSQIAYGRLAKRLRVRLADLGIPSDQIDQYLQGQRAIKEELSGAVHSSARSQMRAHFVPSLISEGLFSLQFLGHHSALAPFLSFWVADRTHAFAEIVVAFFINGGSVSPLAFVIDDQRKRAVPFFAAFFVLQAILLELEPRLDEHHTRMTARRRRSELRA